MSTARKIRPTGNGTDLEKTHLAAGFSLSSVPVVADRYAEYAQGVYVVVVETSDDRMRRRVYLNLPGAQKAVQRAQERGHEARLFLARLDIVGGAL